MERALVLAEQRLGLTSPNPCVGAVVVKDGRILGEGRHQKAGGPHAEVLALQQAGSHARGAQLFVTLEPCNHQGRTPACTQAIIQAGIREVTFAVRDPNPRVPGSGAEALRQAGVLVHEGLCEEEASELNRFFFHHCRTNQPWVISKIACSLDGRTATRRGDSQWITGPESRRRGHELRQQVDAILVGADTILSDDPELTTRLEHEELSQPLRIVLDSTGRVPSTVRVYQNDLPARTLLATTDRCSPGHRGKLERAGVETLELPANRVGRVDLSALLEHMGRRSLISLLVEGGATVQGAFWDAGLVNELWAFQAPVIIGGAEAPGTIAGQGVERLRQASRLDHISIEQLGEDILMRGRVKHSTRETKETACSPEL